MARPKDPSSTAFQPLTAVDLFCGAGGLSQGLAEAGFEILAAADHDPDACATYRLNHPGTVIAEGDLSDRENHHAILRALGPGRLDLLAGGPPCQSFSQIHNHDRLLEDPRNRLYREFVEILGELRPRALMLENVPGMNQLAGGAVRRQIEEDLSLGGHYSVVSGVLDAGDFGTPQRRPRLVFIGLETGTGEPSLPEGSGVIRLLPEAGARQRTSGRGDGIEQLREILQDPSDLRAVTVEQALGDLRDPGPSYTSDPQSAFQSRARRRSREPQDHEPSRIRMDTVRRLEAIPPGGNVHDLPESLLRRYISNERWGPAGDGKRLARRHFYAYRRLHPEWLAWTVNTKADFAYHYELPRGLSVRDSPRLQGFPDSYHFTTAPPGTPGQYKNGARHSRYRQVGNAVPPTLSRAVGNKLAELLSSARAQSTLELAAA
jgi:DNA (cytosine-5)-methyltransferase 1